MDEKLCEANRKPLADQINALTIIIERHTLDIAENKLNIAGQAKDTLHLQSAISTLQKSIDTLVDAIDSLKYKPTKNYEKAMWIGIAVIITTLVNRLLV